MAGSAPSTETYDFAPEERPLFPGSPYTPRHSMPRQIGYLAVGTCAAVGASFPNALITTNSATIAGSLGLYASEIGWLPAVFVAMNATANLLLVKARAQFGIPLITHGLLIAYALASLIQLAFPGFAAALLVRAVNGMAAAGLVTISLYYMLQVFQGRLRPLALIIAISLTQIGPPLARLVPVELLAQADWRGLQLTELGAALFLLAAMGVLPLPKSDCSKAFQRLDFVTVALIIPAMLLTCGVLGQGRQLWWGDTPWIGHALMIAVPLFAVAAILELQRSRPLIQFDWLGTGVMLRFALIALLVRLALAEQTYGAVGLLSAGGLTNDQLHTLFLIVIGAMLLGIVVTIVTVAEHRLLWQGTVAALIVAFGAWLDTDATNLTRPPQLYLSQALIGFGTTLFIGPALAFGFLRMMQRGTDAFITYVVLFSTTQNVGGLAGSALLGSYQFASARAHAAALAEHLTASGVELPTRLQLNARLLAPYIADPADHAAQSGALLLQALLREANILGFADTFRLVVYVALATALFAAGIALYRARERRALMKQEAHHG